MRAPHKYKRRMAAIVAVAAATGLLTGAVFLGTDDDADGATGSPGSNGSVIEAPAPGLVSSDLVHAAEDGGKVVDLALDDGDGDHTQSVEALGKLLPWLKEQGYGVSFPKAPGTA
ncbi:hypothetical protein ACIBEA_32690 [Streptomyces sp. NPDC051555]|uniref:hypothetical protein n=1 Tax=Streptomyces sp. NPDC051555 TaxID=3365657 RepID=UPI00378D111F